MFFTVHYLVLRGFYALERNRTAFYVQCVIGAVNITAAITLVSVTGPRATAAALAGAYLIAYAVGSTVSYAVLRRSVGNLGTAVLVRFLVRMVLATAVATASAYLLSQLLHAVVGERPQPVVAGLVLLVVVAVDVAVFLGLARMLRITEVTEVLDVRPGPAAAAASAGPRRGERPTMTEERTTEEGQQVGEPDDGLPRLRAGDVLAGRYLVADLLGESRGGRFWRAEDQVLARHVALHVIAADDERADGLLEAARLSATVHDRRILRVLDADRVDGLCFVVNEWGAGSSLDIMLARDGPLPPRRAAHLVAEAAAVAAASHDAGVAHGRLAPENLLVDHHGSVRIIGLAVEAALWGLPPGRTSSDVTDLAALLYAAPDRSLVRGLPLGGAARAPGGRPGAAAAEGASRRPPRAGRPVRRGAQRRGHRHPRADAVRPGHRPRHRRRPGRLRR